MRSYVKFCILLIVLAINAGDARRSLLRLHSPQSKFADGNAYSISWTSSGGQSQLSGLLGLSLPEIVGLPTACDAGEASECHQYGDYAQLLITHKSDGCSRIEWTSTFAKRLEDCFDLSEGAHWYGGGETYYQAWPIERETRPEAPMVTGDSLANHDSFGSLTENYWLISTGVSIKVDEDIPLFVSWGSVRPNKVCFVAQNALPYHNQAELNLRYDVCAGANIKSVHQKSLQDTIIDKPTGMPDEVMLLRPFWSTWAQYKENVNQSIVLDFARRIKSEGFELSSHVEIDDDWETCYGEAVFNPTKFPDVKAMVDEVKAMDLRVTLWIHPFINLECPSFLGAVESGYFVKDQKGKAGITSWWQGTNSGIVDFTNEEATNWWRARLELLRTELGIDSFKFDAGETNWLPASVQLTGDDKLQPNLYTTKYVEAVASFGGLIEVRSGRRNQNLPIFSRMLDKDSKWGYDNGLQSLIPTLLHFGIVGYPFVLPDMIGGNAYGDRPSAELYVRWMQANAFMPAVQFSIVPWDYDASVVQICKDVLALREEYKDHIYAAANQAVQDGTPINRPLWWVDPTDAETFLIDNEYLLGDDILVAPVVTEGSVARDIYFPQGTWLAQDGTAYEGPAWVRDYPAPLNALPFFVRQTKKFVAGREQENNQITR